jgi:transcription elongation GreA/GreB family factor
MDEELAFGQTVEVVDPDVRAHVYSLVTAVSVNALSALSVLTLR